MVFLTNIGSEEDSMSDSSASNSDVISEPGSNRLDDSNESEDPLIRSFRERQNEQLNRPQPITSNDPFINLCLHPSEDIICMGCISGNVCLFSYSIEENKLISEIEVHLSTCRALDFSKDGQIIFSAGRDKVIAFVDINTLDVKMFIDDAHIVPLSSLSVVDENLIVSGGDDGIIKIWDIRCVNKHILMYREMQDYISDIIVKDSHKIACTSGDGTLTCFDIRSNKKLGQSEPYRSDLTSCCSTHSDTMIVCGTLTGEFLFYKWNDLSDISGTYKSRAKKEINSLLALSENIVVAGLDDGKVRAFHLFPHEEIGIVGQHTLTVECLDVSHDGTLVASLSPDPTVKFWNVSYLEGFELNTGALKEKVEINLPSSEFEDRKHFFSDLV